jgi:hypothetical protein
MFSDIPINYLVQVFSTSVLISRRLLDIGFPSWLNELHSEAYNTWVITEEVRLRPRQLA